MARPAAYDDLWSTDRVAQNTAYTTVLALADTPVDWSYEVWDDVVAHLSSTDNHDRTIAAQLLARLASSDPDGRIRDDFAALLGVTRDERFVTARHALQAVWLVGLAGDWRRDLVVEGLSERYRECASEKNCTLVRYDIIVGLKQLADATGDERVADVARGLIGLEQDAKYRKKYQGALR